MNRWKAALVLPVRFTFALVSSGVQTIRAITQHGLGRSQPASARLVYVPFAPLSPTGAVLLGCMVTLTPGTTVIDIDMTTREMLVHMLDGSDTQTAIEAIRRDFETPLLCWFAA